MSIWTVAPVRRPTGYSPSGLDWSLWNGAPEKGKQEPRGETRELYIGFGGCSNRFYWFWQSIWLGQLEQSISLPCFLTFRVQPLRSLGQGLSLPSERGQNSGQWDSWQWFASRIAKSRVINLVVWILLSLVWTWRPCKVIVKPRESREFKRSITVRDLSNFRENETCSS